MFSVSVRSPVCADDRWYAASAAELKQAVTTYIDQAVDLDLAAPVVGLIAPHAGYFFSGHVAGAAYRQVRGVHYETVVLLGPDHTGVARGGLAIPKFDAWRTPLGDVPVDNQLVRRLSDQIPVDRVGRDNEHSLEVQLPFLQTALGEFKLLPIMMGSQAPAVCRELGQAIADIVDDSKTLLVASTDLSHFLPDDVTREIDRKTLDYVLDFDPAGLGQALAGSEASACGGGPVASAMWAAGHMGATRAELVKYGTSGDVWHDKSRVVGYAAVVLIP